LSQGKKGSNQEQKEKEGRGGEQVVERKG